MSDDVAEEVLNGRLYPGHHRDVAAEVQTGSVFQANEAAFSIKETRFVTRAKAGITRASLPGEGAPHIGSIRVGCECATVGRDGEGGRIGGNDRWLVHIPVAERVVSHDLSTVASVVGCGGVKMRFDGCGGEQAAVNGNFIHPAFETAI